MLYPFFDVLPVFGIEHGRPHQALDLRVEVLDSKQLGAAFDDGLPEGFVYD